MTDPVPVHYLRIAPGEPLPDLAPLAPYRAVVVLEAEYSAEWQWEVSVWLVETGCAYMMAWGPECATWDESVDYANIEKHLDREMPDSAFIMTTWHAKEPLEEVFWFAGFCAAPYAEAVEIAATLIVHVSGTDAAAEMLERFAAAQALH